MTLLKTVGALFVLVMALYVIVTLIGLLAATATTLAFLIVIVGAVTVAVLAFRHRRTQGRRGD